MATHKEAIRAAIYAWYGDTEMEMAAEEYAHFMEAALRAYLDAMDAVIVLKTATDGMHNAARDWSDTKYGKPIGIEASKGCWDAMIAAAPNPFKEGEP